MNTLAMQHLAAIQDTLIEHQNRHGAQATDLLINAMIKELQPEEAQQFTLLVSAMRDAACGVDTITMH